MYDEIKGKRFITLLRVSDANTEASVPRAMELLRMVSARHEVTLMDEIKSEGREREDEASCTTI